ncbi:uncharacterized protein LOC120681600 isoform X8 [Panicum virgatum]|uniref:uncharacterized protein LOC120681600 isoform X8 n=1 Tax=Panicum virgatum TaxID=38727 RepID=UPI0019D6631B|nr:uncharacterized protein LOC120681600 isoform X8 [Panicum virgatum]
MCNFHRRILLMMAYAHTIVFKFLCRLGKADERCARLELGCRYSAVRPTLVLGQHGGCVLFRDYAFGDLAQMIHAVYMRTAALGLRNAFGKPASEVFHQSSSSRLDCMANSSPLAYQA